jgi:UDP-glucose 4-epimerase
MNKYKRFVVTGALGHIGSHLIRHLVNQFPGVEIIMLDNMMTQRYASLFNLPSLGNYKFIETDVNKVNLHSLLQGADVVVHLAAITDAAASFERASQVEENNYQATWNVAHACLNVGASLIMISSTSVYGTQDDVVTENCLPEDLKPQSPYAKTKLKEEALVLQLCREEGLKAVICRFGTIFGPSPGIRFHTAVNKFCWQASLGLPITVWSTAYDQKRPYLDLADASSAITHIISNNIFDGRTFNILTLNSTVRYIVDTVRTFVPDLEVNFVDSPIMNQLSYEVSCDRFLSEGFIFSGNLQHSIGETICLIKRAYSRDC